ncbi:hypothetical protein [Aeromicrobium sp. UC242_57]|uniref:hypothetical protein n=1 Tax=Aeromicrobium sp. UC242_57 TaxID=3374624 RepID=UPI00378CFF79
MQEPDIVPSSKMYRSENAACEALMEDPPTGSVLSASIDASDLAQIQSLMAGTNGMRMVGEGRCGDVAVVTVGVASSRVQVPAIGANGTPIIAVYQPPINAL